MKVIFEHKEDKRGTTEAERWRVAPWDRSRAETDGQRGITPDRFPIHSVRSAPHRSPRTPPPIPPFRLSIHLIPHSFPVCLSANALQRARLPAHLSVCGSDAGERSRLASHQPRVPLLNEGKTHFPFQRMSGGRCNARAQEEKGSSNLWHPHDSPAKCLFSHLCLRVFSRCIFLSRSGKWMGGI